MFMCVCVCVNVCVCLSIWRYSESRLRNELAQNKHTCEHELNAWPKDALQIQSHTLNSHTHTHRCTCLHTYKYRSINTYRHIYTYVYYADWRKSAPNWRNCHNFCRGVRGFVWAKLQLCLHMYARVDVHV